MIHSPRMKRCLVFCGRACTCHASEKNWARWIKAGAFDEPGFTPSRAWYAEYDEITPRTIEDHIRALQQAVSRCDAIQWPKIGRMGPVV